MDKRKQTYAQSLAAERNLAKARHAKAAYRQAREPQPVQEHTHYWQDWRIDDDGTTETRECRCGATETRAWKGL